MAEIKSTLDIVMERTRHLTLSAEERQLQALTEFKKNLAGLFLKYESSAISLNRLAEEVRSLREASGVKDEAVLVSEIAGRLDLETENENVLVLLRELCRVNTSKIASLLGDCREALHREKEALSDKMRKELDELRGIRGSAVVPCPESSPEWSEKRAAILNRFDAELKEELKSL